MQEPASLRGLWREVLFRPYTFPLMVRIRTSRVEARCAQAHHLDDVGWPSLQMASWVRSRHNVQRPHQKTQRRLGPFGKRRGMASRPDGATMAPLPSCPRSVVFSARPSMHGHRRRGDGSSGLAFADFERTSILTLIPKFALERSATCCKGGRAHAFSPSTAP